MLNDMPSVEELSTKTFLRPSQRDSLQQEIRMLEWALKGRSMHDGRPMPSFTTDTDPADPEQLQESLSRNQKMLSKHDPLAFDLKPSIKNRLYHLMRDLEGKIQADMPSHEMMERPTPVNVDWHMAWEKTHKKNILAWKAIRRMLDPMNSAENFTNIDILRRHEPPKGDPRRYWQNFEEIDFAERTEGDIDQLSDDQYLEFLKLKALEWTAPSICKQLGWKKATFELAMARLRGAVPNDSAVDPGAYSSPGITTDAETLPPAGVKEFVEAVDPLEFKEQQQSAGDGPPPTGKVFGLWLKANLDKRQVHPSDFGRELGVKPLSMNTYLRGHGLMSDALRQAALDKLEALDEFRATEGG